MARAVKLLSEQTEIDDFVIESIKMNRTFANSALQQAGNSYTGTLVSTLLLSTLLALIGVVCGVMIGTGEAIIPLALVFAMAGVVIVFFPHPLFWGTVLLGLVVSGLTRLYLPGLQEIRWLLVPTSMALIVHGLVSPRKDQSIQFPLFLWFSIAFILVLCFSSVINSVPTKISALGIKGYLQVWGLMFGLALIPFGRQTTDTLLKVMLIVAFVQIPLALHQFFVLVPQRVGLGDGIVPVDVVAGSFGAKKFGGGENSVLSAYLVISIAFLVAFWRNGVLKTWLFLFGAATLFLPIILTESKIAVFYLLAAFLTLAWSFRLGRPARVIGMTAGFIALIFVMIAALIAFAPKANQVRSVSDLIEYTWNYNVRSDTSYGGRLSRAGAYRYWAENHGFDRPVSTLIGNGAGVTRKETPSQVLANHSLFDMELEVGRTGATAILWETGIIGLFFVVGMFVSALMTAGRLAKRYRDDPATSAIFTGIQAGVVILFISFFDKSYFVFQIGYQSIFALIFGYLAWWTRYDALASATPAKDNSRALVKVANQAQAEHPHGHDDGDIDDYEYDDDHDFDPDPGAGSRA